MKGFLINLRLWIEAACKPERLTSCWIGRLVCR